jgi:threonine dehydrogenase-like Zn-dependent dehydrogenase
MKTAHEIAIGHGYRPTYDDGRPRPDFGQAVDAIEAGQIDTLRWATSVIPMAEFYDKIAELEAGK